MRLDNTRSRAIACAILVLTLCGCGGSEGQLTPQATFDQVRQAIAGSDWDRVYELTSPSQIRLLEDAWKRTCSTPDDPLSQVELTVTAKLVGLSVDQTRSMSYRQLFGLMMARMFEQSPQMPTLYSEAQFDEAVVTGDRCTVHYTMKKVSQTMQLVREDGRWYTADLVGQ